MNQATHNLLSNLNTEQLEQLCTDNGYLDMEFRRVKPLRFADNNCERIYSYFVVYTEDPEEGVLRHGHIYVTFNHTNGDITADF